MPHPLESGTIRILKPDGSTAGTGFLVSIRLAVTCAHVVDSAKAKPGDVVKFKYHLGDINAQEAKVIENGWFPENDVAVLELTEKPPKWIRPIIMQSSKAREGHSFQGLGYPDDGPIQTRWVQGNIGGLVQVDGYSNPLLQIRGDEIDTGLSGCAIVDYSSGKVIGMLTAYRDLKRPNTDQQVRFAYAIPIETLWEVYPDIKKEIPLYQIGSSFVEGIHLLPYDYSNRIQNFLTEYLGTLEQPEPFGGRDDALKTLDTWLDGDTQRLLLVAPAGRGKSALLVRWLDRLIDREDLALVFVPISIRFRTNLASTFFASLASRLAYLQGEDVPTSAETSADIWHGLANAYLSKPLADEKKLLVVLDGLDESGDWEATTDLIPAELPRNVRVVVSARLLAGELNAQSWLSRLGWKRKGRAATFDLDPLDFSGIADVLHHMGIPLEELSRRVDIVAELHRLTEGDPLLVNLYVEDLWLRGNQISRIQPEDLQKIKPGYEGYFERWWIDQKKLWGSDAPLREKGVRLVFNLLCSALGGLTKDNILELDSENILDTYAIEDSIDALKRYVIGIPDERKENEIGYVLTHPKLRNYFWDRLTEKERYKLESRFVAWGDRTIKALLVGQLVPADIPRYILQYYTAHLERANAPVEKYLPLVDYPYWHQAWFTYEGAYGGYFQDIKLTWKICHEFDQHAAGEIKKAPFLGKEIRCALIEASLHSLLARIPSKLLTQLVRNKFWTLQQAWTYIRQMPEGPQQAESIIMLASVVSEPKIPELYVELTHIKDEVQRANVLTALAQRLPEEYLNQVLTLARQIDNESSHADVLCALARHMPEAQLSDMVSVARLIKDDWERTRVLIEVTRRLPEVRHEAFISAKRLEDMRELAGAMTDLAEYYPQALREALNAIKQISDEWARARILVNLVERLDSNHIFDLLPYIKHIEDEKIRSAALGSLVTRIPIRYLKDVWTAANSLRDKQAYISILGLLAQRSPEIQLNNLLEMARRFQLDDTAYAYLLSMLSANTSQLNLPEILTELTHIKDEVQRANVLTALAQRLPEEYLNRVLTLARQIDNESSRADVLCALAGHMPEAQLGDMVSVIRLIKDDWERTRVLIEVTRRLPEVRHEAFASAKQIKIAQDQVHMLVRLLKYLPQAEKDVIISAGQISDPWTRVECLCRLADHLSTATEALSAVQHIESEKARIDFLAEISKYIPEVAKEGLTVARKIDDQVAQRTILLKLAKSINGSYLNEILDLFPEEDDRNEFIQDLAEDIGEENIDTIFKESQRIQDLERRGDILSILVHRFPSRYMNAALSLIQEQLSNPSDQYHEDSEQMLDRRTSAIRILEDVAGQMSTEQLNNLMTVVRHLRSGWERAVILFELPKLLPEIVAETLAEIRQIPKENKRALLLSRMVEYAPETKDEILSILQLVGDKYERASVLTALAEHTPETTSKALFAISQLDDKETRLRHLNSLIEYLPEVYLAEVLEWCQHVQDEDEYARILCKLSGCYPKTRLQEIYTASNRIEDEDKRALVLSTLAQFFPDATKEALTVLHQMKNEEKRAQMLSNMVQYLSEGFFPEVLSEVRNMGNEKAHNYLLKDLVLHVPDSLWSEVLILVRSIKAVNDRGSLLSCVAQRSPEVVEEAIVTVSKIEHDATRSRLLKSLVVPLIRRLKTNNSLLEETVPILSARTRNAFLHDLEALLAVFIEMGNANTDYEIFRAVRDVVTWWP